MTLGGCDWCLWLFLEDSGEGSSVWLSSIGPASPEFYHLC